MATGAGKQPELGALAALWDASRAALLAALLAFPILSLRLEQNARNDLVLEERWGLIGVAAAAIFALRLVTRSPTPQGFVRALLFCAVAGFIAFAAYAAIGAGFQAGFEAALARFGAAAAMLRQEALTRLGIEEFWLWVALFALVLFIIQLMSNPASTFGFLRFVFFAAIVAAGVYAIILVLRSNLPDLARFGIASLIGVVGFITVLLYAPIPSGAEIKPQQVALRRDIAAALKPLFLVFCLATLFAFPIVMLTQLGPQASLKWINNYGVQILIYVMLGWGLNIVVGLAGLLDLGYVAFYAVGAYAYALLSTTFGLSFWICLPLAGILAAFWGILLGFPVLRLRGDYLAIVTLAFGEIIRVVLINWTEFSNGYAGISSIPRVTFFGLPFVDGEGGFAQRFGLEFLPIHRTIFLFYVILCLALVTNFVTLRLRRLPLGRAWEALREDEIACRSLGINTVNTKLTAFALGAMFGGFAGAFFAVRQNFVSPDSFTFIESATILAIVVLGGMGSQIGVALAAIAMIGGTEILRELDFLKNVFGADFDPTQYRMLIFGLGMVAMMVWKPRGLISTRTPSIFLSKRRPVAADLLKEGHG